MGALKNPLAKLAARQLERTAYRHAAAVIALSPDMKRRVVGRRLSREPSERDTQ